MCEYHNLKRDILNAYLNFITSQKTAVHEMENACFKQDTLTLYLKLHDNISKKS